jgi:hypothetical protein
MSIHALQKSALIRGGCLAVFATFALLSSPAIAQTELEKYKTAERMASEQLAKFDTLDFDVFTNQKWDRLKESHANDIVVHWPDGHETKGIEKHIEDLKAMFVYAPDNPNQGTPRQDRFRRMDKRHWRDGGDIYEADADRRWQIDPADRQAVQTGDVHGRALEGWRHGSGISVLGQPDIHETDRRHAVSIR